MANKELYIGTSTPKSNEVVWIRPLKSGGVALYAYVYNKWQVLKLVNGKGTLPVDDDEVIDPAIPGGNYYTKDEIDEKIADILGIDADQIDELVEIITDDDTVTGLLTELKNKAYVTKGNVFDISGPTDQNEFKVGGYGLVISPYTPSVSSDRLLIYHDHISFSRLSLNSIHIKTLPDSDRLYVCDNPTSAAPEYLHPIAYLEDIPSVTPQVQSDWNESDTTSKAYILNKPTIPDIPENILFDDIVENDSTYTTIEYESKNVPIFQDMDNNSKNAISYKLVNSGDFRNYFSSGSWNGGMAISDGVILLTFNKGWVALLDYEQTIKGANFEDCILATGQLASYDTNNHANSVSFGNMYYNNNTIPLVYVSKDYGNSSSGQTCYVENITWDTSTKQITSTIIQTINTTVPIASNGGAGWCIDRVTNKIFLKTAKGSSQYPNIPSYTYQWEIPSISSSSVTLTADTALDTMIIQNDGVLQDIEANNNFFIDSWGYPESSHQVDGIRVVDWLNKEIVFSVEIPGLNEAEGVSVYDGKIYVVGHTTGADPVANSDVRLYEVIINNNCIENRHKGLMSLNYLEPKLVFFKTNATSVTAENNVYYRFTTSLSSLTIILPSTAIAGDQCGFSFTTGSGFSSYDITSDLTIKKQTDFEIEASKTYELIALYNGDMWLVTISSFEN